MRVKISQLNETRSASRYSGNTDLFLGLLSPKFTVVAKIKKPRNQEVFFKSLNSGHILKLIMNVSFVPQLVGKS